MRFALKSQPVVTIIVFKNFATVRYAAEGIACNNASFVIEDVLN